MSANAVDPTVALAQQLQKACTGQSSHVAMDALLNVFLQVARVNGVTAQAGEVLLALGGGLVIAAMQQEQRPAGAPIH